MNWIVSLLGIKPSADSLRLSFEASLAARKALRSVQSQRVKAGQSAARRKAWAKDPLRNQMRGAA